MLVLAHANINGLMGKEIPLRMFIQTKKIDIMFLVETWLSADQIPQLSNIISTNSFQMIGRIVGGRRGQRGLICLVNQSIKLQVHEIYNSLDGLYIIVKFNDQYYASV